MTEHDDALGPVNYVVVEFPGGLVTADGFGHLLGIVRSGIIAVLDLEFFGVNESGELSPESAAEVGARAAIDLTNYERSDASLLDDDDKMTIAARVSPGSTVAVLVYEDLSLLAVLASWEHEGATILAEGPVAPDDLLRTVDGVGGNDD